MSIDHKDIAEAAGKATDKRPTPTAWYVHESYAIEDVEVEGITEIRVYEGGPVEHVEGKQQVDYITAVPLGAETRSPPMRIVGSGEYAEVYSPLRYHDLFLEFAKLADEPITPEVVLEWCATYGVLGTPVREAPVRGGCITGRTDWLQPVEDFARHASTAQRVLRLHEALTVPGEQNAEMLPSHGARGETPKQLRADAERVILRTVNDILSSEVYPVWYHKKGGGYIRGEAFRSLLGALYVQFERLLDTPEDHLRRCRWWKCNRIIDFEPPDDLPDQGSSKNDRRKGYKKRSDADFCEKGHADKHYYMTVTKPKRNAERLRKRLDQ